jgi:hypothetical protein
MEGPGQFFKKVALVSMTTLLLNTTETQAQNQNKYSTSITNAHVETHNDQNMPQGFRREQVFGNVAGKEKVVASLFYFEDGKTKTCFISNDEHPDAFDPDIDYGKIDQIAKQKGIHGVIFFAGAYKAQSGDIEGVALENGKQVGEHDYSKWSGFVYVTPAGSVELYRCKDQDDKFDKQSADRLTQKAKNEKGSLFQQIPAIWNGQKKLNSTSQDKFEFRAICQTQQGKKLVLNCTEKITLDDFLEMALDLKDNNGQPLIDDLMLEDTGVYSYGLFKDKSGKTFTMVDENYANNKSGYTNTVVIGN